MTKDEAIRILDEVIPPPEHHTVDLDHLRIVQAWQCIKEALTAEPRKHGHWIKTNSETDIDGNAWYSCSECKHGDYHAEDAVVPYCWNCGAIMDEVEE